MLFKTKITIITGAEGLFKYSKKRRNPLTRLVFEDLAVDGHVARLVVQDLVVADRPVVDSSEVLGQAFSVGLYSAQTRHVELFLAPRQEKPSNWSFDRQGRIQDSGGGGGGGTPPPPPRPPEGTVEQALPQDSIIASVSPVCGDVSATQIVPRRLVLEIKMIKSNIQYKKISKQSNTTMYVKRKKVFEPTKQGLDPDS